MFSLGKPNNSIVQFLKKIYNNERYSADDIANIIDDNIATLPAETQQIIQNKIIAAKIENPSLVDGCEELQAIKLVEIAKTKEIDIEEVLGEGKTEPRTEDDDAKLAKAIR